MRAASGGGASFRTTTSTSFAPRAAIRLDDNSNRSSKRVRRVGCVRQSRRIPTSTSLSRCVLPCGAHHASLIGHPVGRHRFESRYHEFGGRRARILAALRHGAHQRRLRLPRRYYIFPANKVPGLRNSVSGIAPGSAGRYLEKTEFRRPGTLVFASCSTIRRRPGINALI
jgi:hypothetical protein